MREDLLGKKIAFECVLYPDTETKKIENVFQLVINSSNSEIKSHKELSLHLVTIGFHKDTSKISYNNYESVSPWEYYTDD